LGPLPHNVWNVRDLLRRDVRDLLHRDVRDVRDLLRRDLYPTPIPRRRCHKCL